MNNKTTATAPLRASETVDILSQQILGNIERDGQGQFYTVEPSMEMVIAPHNVVEIQDLESKE